MWQIFVAPAQQRVGVGTAFAPYRAQLTNSDQLLSKTGRRLRVPAVVGRVKHRQEKKVPVDASAHQLRAHNLSGILRHTAEREKAIGAR